MKNLTITKPITIIGVPRSGTTILYKLFTEHKDTAYFENYSSRFFQHPKMFRFIPILMKYQKWRYNITRPKRSEGYVWDRFYTQLEYLDEKNATDEIKEYYYKAIKYQLKAFNAKRFVSKNPQNCLRIKWINELFPDAYYIIIWRNPKSVISSMYQIYQKKKPRWSDDKVLNMSRKNPNYFRGWYYRKKKLGADLSEIEACIKWYKLMTNTLKKDLSLIKNKMFEINYSEFIKNPSEIIKNLYEFSELNWYNQLEKVIPDKLEADNDEKWKKLPTEQKLILEQEFPDK